MLDIGATAPNPEIETHLGYKGSLDHFWKDGPLILFFYPKNDTMICTKQACSLQESIAQFGEIGANVLGSSTANAASHTAYAGRHNISFPLACDERGDLARAFDAFRSLLRISKRITYVIDSNGRIIGNLHNELSVSAHMEMINKALETVKA